MREDMHWAGKEAEGNLLVPIQGADIEKPVDQGEQEVRGERLVARVD